MNQKIIVAAVGVITSLGSMAVATPIQFNTGGGTYTYNTDSGGTTATTGDPNAVLSNASFFNEAIPQPGNQGTYFVPSANDQVGTVSYTFDAAPGEVFATASTSARFNVYYYPVDSGTITGYIAESITTSADSTPAYVDSLIGNGGGDSSYDTNSLTADVAGSDSFTLTFALFGSSAAEQPNFYIQLFREDPPQDYGSDQYPFVVSTTSIPAPTPEPASIGLLGLGALATLTRRPRRV
jgi:hypothetical protein